MVAVAVRGDVNAIDPQEHERSRHSRLLVPVDERMVLHNTHGRFKQPQVPQARVSAERNDLLSVKVKHIIGHQKLESRLTARGHLLLTPRAS